MKFFRLGGVGSSTLSLIAAGILFSISYLAGYKKNKLIAQQSTKSEGAK